jgi:ArsR family transcriptional regulator
VSRVASEPAFIGWMSALGDTTRARILRLVERQELNVGELTTILDLPQSTTSRHLKQLSDDGWLDAQRDGTSRLYRFTEHLSEPRRALWDLVRGGMNDTIWVTHDDEQLAQVMAARRSRSEAFFADAAGNWDNLRDELFGPRLELAVVSSLLSPSTVVADLGCGTGRLSASLAPFVEHVWSVDNSEAMLRAAAERLTPYRNVELRQGALEQLPIPSQCVDVAVLCMVLHYLPEPLRALSEAARVLKPNAKLVVIDIRTHDREDFRSSMGHVWSGFGEDQLKLWLAQAGLTAMPSHFLGNLTSSAPSHGRPEVFIQTSYKSDSQ